MAYSKRHAWCDEGDRDPRRVDERRGLALGISADRLREPPLGWLDPQQHSNEHENRDREWRRVTGWARLWSLRAGVTQSVECLLPKQNVAGSSPVSRSTFSNMRGRA